MTADQLAQISTDPLVMHGQAVIAGTRVPVSVILLARDELQPLLQSRRRDDE